MKRSLFLGLIGLTLWLGAALSASAFRKPAREPLPNLDRRQIAPPGLAASHAAAVGRLHAGVPGAKVDTDRRTGVPAFVTAPHGFLTGPGGEGRGVSPQTARAFAANDPHRVTKAFLREHPGLFGHGPEVIAGSEVKRNYTTAHNGLKTMVWQQQLDGIPVYDAKLISHVTRNDELVSVCSQCLPNLDRAAALGVGNRQAVEAAPPVSAAEAIVKAAQAIGDELTLAQVGLRDAQPAGPSKRQRFTGRPVLNGDVTLWLTWLPLSRDMMRLCWEVHLVSRARGEGFQVLVDAQSGEVLLRQCLTRYISNASYAVFYEVESPSPFMPGHPTPQTGQPPLTNRYQVTGAALDTNASPNGWIDDGVNETMGNNVDGHTDWDADDLPDLPRPQGNPNRVFGFPLDLTRNPTNSAAAAVVQLFFWNNWMHDRLYQLGFTEAAGNYQNTNFGRGGVEGDAVLADAQDGGGFNNANFYPPPDGQPGRMQMYLFDGPTPYRDGDFDATVVFHEFVHGLSTRLVGGGNALNALQSGGLGEGWSDFYSLALLALTNADVNATYPSGGYLTYHMSPGFEENYYYGIRRYPYCTDMNKNPLTFKDIDPNQADPHAGVPISPITPFDPYYASEVHYQGEVWCAALWEMRANLIAKYGYDVGNELALQLTTDGMKLTSPDPNFLQARDGIIQADLVNNGYANFDEIWRAFAKRGMGGSAFAPDSSTTIGVQEAFDLPGLAFREAVAIDLATGNANGVVDVNECNELLVVLYNNGRSNVSQITASLTVRTPGVAISQADSLYPDILPASFGTNMQAFRFYTMPSFVCGSIIKFSLVVQTDLGLRTINFDVETGQVGQPVRYNNNTPVAIPVFDPAGADSPIVVGGFVSAVSKVTVSLHVKHTLPFSLAMELIGPDGTRVQLVANPFSGFFGEDFGTACSPDSARTTFDDKATLTIDADYPPWEGTYKPLQPLATFKGKNGPAANGVWRLHATDSFFFGGGSIECWSLQLSPTLCSDGGGDCSTDVALSGSLSPNPPYVGTNITYTFAVTNRGPNAARNVLFTDRLPGGTTFVSATSDSGGQCTLVGGVVNCLLGTLPNAARSIVTVIVQPGAGSVGLITNIATVASSVTDGNPTNNTVTLISTVLPPTPVIVAAGVALVSESASPPNGGLDAGETVTLELGLQNIGSLETANLVARLLATNGVASPSAPQTYGRMRPGDPEVSRPFTFTASGASGATILATLQLTDGATTLSNVVFAFGLSANPSLTNQSRISVPDVGPATNLYPSSISVHDVPGLIRKVTVTLLGVQHTSPQDLDVLLVGPRGETVLLMSDAGGGFGLSGVNLTFDDGGTLLPEAEQIVAGTYQPTDYPPADTFPAPAPGGPYGTGLGLFNGSEPNGVWSLYVVDDAGGDSGRISGGWALTLSTVDPVNASADLKVVGRGAPDPVAVGSNVTYTLLLTNLGPDAAEGVMLTNALPPNAAFLGATASVGACTNTGGQVICALGTLPSQANAAITIVATALKSGTLTNVATISSQAQDPNSLNSRAVVLTSVNAEADLDVRLNGPVTLPINATLTYTVSVSNRGPDRASGVWLTNFLATALTNIAFSTSQGSCTLSSNRLVCNLASMNSAAGATVTVQGRSLTLGKLTNSAIVSALSPVDRVQGNNSGLLVTTVSDPYVIVVPDGAGLVSESFVPPSGGLDPNETVRLALRLRNVGVSNTTALVATLRHTGGVTAPSGPQDYGVLAANGSTVSREFTFTAAGTPGGTVIATLDLQDGANVLGTATYEFVLGGGARFVSPGAVSIPDNTRAVPYPSTIMVSNLAGVVGKVTLTLSNLTHAYASDLDVLLVGPEGQAALVMSDAGSGNGITNVTLGFDDVAAGLLPKFDRITSGVYRPTEFPPADSFAAPAPAGPYSTNLSVFVHTGPNGPWSLYIVDDAFGDLGALSGGWMLELTTVGYLSAPPQPPQLLAPVILENGNLAFTVQGDAGSSYIVEASGDLATWTAIGTVPLSGSSAIFEDVNTGSFSRRFYRVRSNQ
jgi:uncharacterized repeat protein (TIGR01451 family)